MSTDVKKSTGTATKKIVLVGVFGAISTVLMFLSFNVPFIPTFVKLDFSDLPVLLGGYILGPVYGSFIAIIKILLNFVYNGSMTYGIGETVNLIGSLSFMLPAVILYQRNRNFKTAIMSLIVGTIAATVVLLTANYFVMFPLYATAMNFPMEKIVTAAHALNPYVTDLASLMTFALLPFNIIKFGLNSILALFLYKRLAKALKFEH
ncbi:ECF transporter S component [Granulicatella adiacens]